MKVALLQLNEINFDVVERYISAGFNLPHLAALNGDRVTTVENESYENLEPWIQWVSFYHSKPFSEHRVFRLGDGPALDTPSIFDAARQDLGLSVGAIAPMNYGSAHTPFDFFIPDPWSGGVASDQRLNTISDLISEAVNNNTGEGLSFKKLAKLFFSLVKIYRISDWLALVQTLNRRRKNSFGKAIFLDEILARLHLSLIKKYKTNFSTIFLNAGAHIQHHYFLNSKVLLGDKSPGANPDWYINPGCDPLLEVFEAYDAIIGWYRSEGIKVIVMTGLQQVPVAQSEFYYRLSDHEKFLKLIDVPFLKVKTRMTRDFLIEFSDSEELRLAFDKLSMVSVEGEKLFGELDVGDLSIFCSLTYPRQIDVDTTVSLDGESIQLLPYVNFVAIKNGIHHCEGTLAATDFPFKEIIGERVPLWECGDHVISLLKANIDECWN